MHMCMTIFINEEIDQKIIQLENTSRDVLIARRIHAAKDSMRMREQSTPEGSKMSHTESDSVGEVTQIKPALKTASRVAGNLLSKKGWVART